MNTKPYSRKTREAIKRYGVDICERAYRAEKAGLSAASLTGSYPHILTSTRSADAAVNAGREIAEGRKFTAAHGTPDDKLITVDGVTVPDTCEQCKANMAQCSCDEDGKPLSWISVQS